MNLFATNLPLVRKIVEQLWREIAHQAGEANLLDVEAARIEVTIKVVPVRKMPDHYVPPAVNVKYLRAVSSAKVFAAKPAKMSRKGTVETLWKRLMVDEE